VDAWAILCALLQTLPLPCIMPSVVRDHVCGLCVLLVCLSVFASIYILFLLLYIIIYIIYIYIYIINMCVCVPYRSLRSALGLAPEDPTTALTAQTQRQRNSILERLQRAHIESTQKDTRYTFKHNKAHVKSTYSTYIQSTHTSHP
jgi:hypothetical protein